MGDAKTTTEERAALMERVDALSVARALDDLKTAEARAEGLRRTLDALTRAIKVAHGATAGMDWVDAVRDLGADRLKLADEMKRRERAEAEVEHARAQTAEAERGDGGDEVADDIESIRTLVDELADADEAREREVVAMLRDYVRERVGEHDADMAAWDARHRVPRPLPAPQPWRCASLWDALKGGEL